MNNKTLYILAAFFLSIILSYSRTYSVREINNNKKIIKSYNPSSRMVTLNLNNLSYWNFNLFLESADGASRRIFVQKMLEEGVVNYELTDVVGNNSFIILKTLGGEEVERLSLCR